MAPPRLVASRAARWRPSVLTKFALISLVLITAVGVAAGILLGDTIRERTLSDAIRTADVAANVGITPLLRPDDLARDFIPLTTERQAELDAVLRGSLSSNGVVRMKLWNRQHWLVYSDKPELRGRWFPSNPLLDDAFAGGRVSEITDLDAPEELEERDFGQLLSVYVPIHAGADGSLQADGPGEIVGAFEIYLPYAPIATAIREDTQRLWSILGGGLALLWLALWRLVARASRALRQQVATNRHQARHDGLTDLPNRRLLHEHLDAAIHDARATSGRLAVVVCDLDRFKEINDALGHAAGDELLCAVGPRLAGPLGDGDLLARLGGDEFAIVLSEVSGTDDALAVVDELSARLSEPFSIAGLDVDLRASFGIAVHPDHGRTAEELVRHADVAMYVAKQAKVGRELYDESSDVFSIERLELATEVRRAIDQHELLCHYQPKVDLATGRTVGVEALVRWQHPDRGLIGPGEFMGLIENTELIRPMTIEVLEIAVTQAAQWRSQGIDLPIAINLSARSATDATMPDAIAEMLARHGLPPAGLEIELTESALLDDPARARIVLDRLAEMGTPLAIDDFGTGYASLAYLTELPVSVVKIDQSFVSRLTERHNDEAVVRFSAQLGETLGLEVVAEGIEDAATASAALGLGVHTGQGYFFSRPLPPDALAAWVRASGSRTEVPA